ncbi:MAG: YmaF family protein [Limnochordia bacterium]|nr:YmaF family protein [Limnochordia bacterium]
MPGRTSTLASRCSQALPCRHIHFASGITTLNRGHIHEFFFATLIDDPLRR